MIHLNNNLQHSAEITFYVIKNYFLLYIYLILYKKFPTKLFSIANKTLNLTGKSFFPCRQKSTVMSK